MMADDRNMSLFSMPTLSISDSTGTAHCGLAWLKASTIILVNNTLSGRRMFVKSISNRANPPTCWRKTPKWCTRNYYSIHGDQVLCKLRCTNTDLASDNCAPSRTVYRSVMFTWLSELLAVYCLVHFSRIWILNPLFRAPYASRSSLYRWWACNFWNILLVFMHWKFWGYPKIH